MRDFQTAAVFKALLLAGSATSFVVATPAMAQNSAVNCQTNPDAEECADDTPAPTSSAIVVTGSRIQRQDYTANSPTVTVDEAFLRDSSTAAVEQQLNKLPQFVVSQSSTAANNSESGLLPAGGDIQPNATNTPGAATVSLRGIGANRTLVLIDGRRGTPSNASGAVDVSTIPSAALQRVEVVSGGASATYGADAVAGVTNFILKRDFQGIELDAQFGISQDGNGFEYQIGGIMGTDFPDGRGNVSLAMSMNTREFMLQRDNPNYQRLWADPENSSGQFFFVPRPGAGLGGALTPAGQALLSSYFPGNTGPTNTSNAARPVNPAAPGTLYFNEDDSIFLTGFGNRGGTIGFFKPWAAVDDGLTTWKTLSNNTLAYINSLTPQTVPTDRYNFLARGNYEINDWIGVFAQGMFSHTTTYTVQEPGPLVGGWGVNIPWGSGVYTGSVPYGATNYTNQALLSSIIRNGDTFNGAAYVDPTPGVLTDNPNNPAFAARYASMLGCGAAGGVGGCSNSQVFQQVVPDQLEALLNNRTNPNAPFSITGFLPNPRETFSDVKTYTLIAGLEGSIPGSDWTWEAFVNHGISQNLSRQTGMYSLDRVRAVFSSPNFGQGFRFQGNPQSAPPGFGAATGTCATGLDFFDNYQGISADCREAISADVSNRITTRQTIAEVNIQGGLFDLPAGQLRFAAGASYRENRFEFVNETLSTAGRSFLDQTIGIYPSANMPNSGIDAKEIYGELLIPVITDFPLIQELNLEVGGRMSDYSTTGVSYTFKVLGDWQVTDWLRFRGGFNRAERQPNIAELLLAPQQAFRTDSIGDVCSLRHNNPGSANPATNSGGASRALDVQAVCMELMARDNGGVFVPTTDPQSYYQTADVNNLNARNPTGGGSAFSYSVGNQYYREFISADAAPLKSEVADTWTAGAVIQSPFSSGPLSRLNLTVDYFNVKIKDPIGGVPAGGILLRCVSEQYNPLVTGAATGGLGSATSRARAQAAIAASTCPGAIRNPLTSGNDTQGANTAAIFGTYSNDGGIKLSGIDATASWSADVGPGTVFVSLNGNYMLDFSVQALAGQPFLNYVGTTGTSALGVNSGSSFEYRILGNLGYTWGPANLSLSWQHIPKTEDLGEANFLNGIAPRGTDQSGLPAYNLFSLNGGYQLTDAVRLRFGVDNLFNTKPPLTNIDVDLDDVVNPGNAANPQADGDGDGVTDLGALRQGGYSLFHDVQGRRFSFGANIRF